MANNMTGICARMPGTPVALGVARQADLPDRA
jgi:hypothetical protein